MPRVLLPLEQLLVAVQPARDAEGLALGAHRRRVCTQVAGRGHQRQHSFLLRIRLDRQQVVLAESRLDTLNRMEVAVFPQQQRAKLCPQRGRVAALVEVAADRVAGGVYLLLLI